MSALPIPLSIPVTIPIPIPRSFEPATVLLSVPEGKPKVANLPEYDWAKVMRDVEHELPNNASNQTRLAEWREFITARPKCQAEAERAESLPKWDFSVQPAAHGPISSEAIANRAVRDSAIVTTQPRSIRSSVNDGREGRDAEQARRRANDESVHLVLEPGTFAMVAMEYDNAGGCQIPRMLVQLPAAFEVDTTNADAQFDVKWWEPQPGGKYDGPWRKWMQSARRQHVSSIKRSMITHVNVKFTRTAELVGGIRRLSAETKERIQSDPNSKYAEYSGSV